MRTRNLKYLLACTTVLFSAGTIVVVALGLLQPIDLPEIGVQAHMEPVATTHTSAVQQIPDLGTLQRLANKNIRQRLFDPPPKPQPVAQPKPPPNIRLLGTIINATKSQAMIAGQGGQVELKRVGDIVGEANNTAKILQIHAGHITVEHEGEEIDIPIVENTRRSR